MELTLAQALKKAGRGSCLLPAGVGKVILSRYGSRRKEELFELFDGHDDSVMIDGKRALVHRSEAHGDYWLGRFYHRGANVFVVHDGKIFVPVRAAAKDVYPGCADVSVSEHVKVGESYLVAAVRGCREELGLRVREGDLQELFTRKVVDGNNHEIAWYYLLKTSARVKLSEESSGGFWAPLPKVNAVLKEKGLRFRKDHAPALRKFLSSTVKW